jgi:hypothetical protein
MMWAAVSNSAWLRGFLRWTLGVRSERVGEARLPNSSFQELRVHKPTKQLGRGRAGDGQKA